MEANQLVGSFIYEWRLGWIERENQRLKTKTRSLAEAEKAVSFNPNSAPQLQALLYDEKHLAFPVIDRTRTKAPATGGDTLEKLLNHARDPRTRDFLEALIDYKTVDKLLTAFLPAILAAPMGPDGWHYLFGFFNLGGTVSGRLSSSDPNLQNLPAKGELAKLIKRCFKAPPGWLFVGIDFASLEDRISALTTRDPNKLKIYTDGFDGHCLRAFSYFGEQMPEIDPDSVESINSIARKYPDQRQESKTPTFLLTYGGTFIGMMAQLGWNETKARTIETRYHELYQVSDAWIAAKIQEAGQQGYVTVAFGLRLRTPLLRQVILGTSRTPYEAEAEGRTAGNALGQSWCLLNTRASVEFMANVRSGKYRLDIRPCAHIHDSQYYLIPDDMEALTYVNEHLVQAVEWQDDPAIWHDDVKLGGDRGAWRRGSLR
jgi:DNA polymerase-1